MKKFIRAGLGSLSKVLGGRPAFSLENMECFQALDAAIKRFILRPEYEVIYWDCSLIAQKERGEVVKRKLRVDDDISNKTRVSLEWGPERDVRYIYCRRRYATFIPTPREKQCRLHKVSDHLSTHKVAGYVTEVVGSSYRFSLKDPFQIHELIEGQFESGKKPRLGFWANFH